MKDEPVKLTTKLKTGAAKTWQRLSPYKALIALLVIAAIYGYVLLQINTLKNVQPSSSQINAQANPTINGRIDAKAVKQLQDLQDNHVSVQTLFDQQRNNPFQE